MIDELTLGVVPFRGSWAVQRGLLTERVLRGHRYRRLFPDIYLLASAPADLAARSQGATLLVPGRGVLSGYSAAELLGARCAPADANVELTVPGGDLREQPGLTVHRDLLADDEVTDAAGLLTTTALRTAWDLARWLPTVEAVVAMDALARVGRFAPGAVLQIHGCYPRARGRRRVPGVIALCDPRAESPMESRSRLVLTLRGLPRPELQYRVFDESGEFIARLDMAYPPLKLAMEYDGRGHLDAWQQASDARRLNLLDAAGWSVLRFTATDVMRSRHYGRPGPRGLPAPLRRSRVVNSSTPTSRPERRFAARRGSWTWGISCSSKAGRTTDHLWLRSPHWGGSCGHHGCAVKPKAPPDVAVGYEPYRAWLAAPGGFRPERA